MRGITWEVFREDLPSQSHRTEIKTNNKEHYNPFFCIWRTLCQLRCRVHLFSRMMSTKSTIFCLHGEVKAEKILIHFLIKFITSRTDFNIFVHPWSAETSGHLGKQSVNKNDIVETESAIKPNGGTVADIKSATNRFDIPIRTKLQCKRSSSSYL